MPTSCVLRLFGALRLEVEGEVLAKFPTRRSAFILARLALAKDNRVARDELAGQLWPDDFLDSTRIRLRQELTRLRQVVGELGIGLHADRQSIEIESGALPTDAHKFTEHIAAARASADLDTEIHHLQEAVGYVGGPFMAGYHDPWVLANRREYAEMARRAWLDLASAFDRVGWIEKSMGASAGAVRQAPLDLEANSMLIRTLASCGRLAQARQAFVEFDELHFRELGQRAPYSLRSVLGELAPATESELSPGTSAPSGAMRRPGPLFGRETEIAAILAALANPGACVVLVGAFGVGKTHLLREAAWKFSQASGLPVSNDVDPGAVMDGLLVIDSAKGPQKLADQIQNYANQGWRVLAESRKRLDADPILEILVLPLPTPAPAADAAEIQRNPSVQLLASRASDPAKLLSNDRVLADLAELARRLDGFPGPLKMFANRLTVLPADQLIPCVDLGLAEYVRTPTRDEESLDSSLCETLAALPESARDLFFRLQLLCGASSDLATALAQSEDPAQVLHQLESNCLILVDDDGSRRHYRVPAPLSNSASRILTDRDRLPIEMRTWQILATWAYSNSRKLIGLQEKSSYDSVQAELPKIMRGIRRTCEMEPATAGLLVVAAWRTVCARGNPSADSESLLAGATASADLLDPSTAGEMWTGVGKVLSIAGRLGEAEAAFLRAISTYESIGDQEGAAWAKLNYAYEVLNKTDVRRATELAKQAADATSRPGDRALGLWLYAFGLADLGDTATAIRVGEEVFAERLQNPEPTAQGRAYLDLAELYRRVGRPEASRPLLVRSIEWLRKSGIQDFLFESLVNLAHLNLHLSEAEGLISEAEDIGTRMGSSSKLLRVAQIRMRYASHQHDTGVLLKIIDEAMRLTAISQSAEERSNSFKVLAEVLRKHDKPEYANAVMSSLGVPIEGPVSEAWKSLLASDSHTTVCVLALAMAKEALSP